MSTGYGVARGEVWGLLFFVLSARGIFFTSPFNLYWLYRFGSVLEPWNRLEALSAFWVAATAVSSTAEYAISSDVGVGASGFGYALFGIVWIGSLRHPYLRQVLDGQTVVTFLVWAVYCIALTQTGVMNVANAAHFGGLFFGAMCAYAFLDRGEAWIRWAAIAITALVLVPLIYAPWLSSWQLAQAQKAYDAGNYQAALDHYGRVNLDGYEDYVQQLRADCLAHLNR